MPAYLPVIVSQQGFEPNRSGATRVMEPPWSRSDWLHQTRGARIPRCGNPLFETYHEARKWARENLLRPAERERERSKSSPPPPDVTFAEQLDPPCRP